MTTPRPITEERQKAALEASRKKVKELEKDQEWLDKKSEKMTEGQKRELFRILSRKCKATTLKNGKILLGCPLPNEFIYCEAADSNSVLKGENQKKHMKKVSDLLNEGTTCIDVNEVSNTEGGTHQAPYVPWGPYSGKKKGVPSLKTGNKSGVTVGSGVDLGQVGDKKAYLKKLEAAGVSQETRDRITPFLGKRKDEACKALSDAKAENGGSFQLPKDDVERMDCQTMQSRKKDVEDTYNGAWKEKVQPQRNNILNELKKPVPDQAKIDAWQAEIDATPKFHQLPCPEQTVLYSTLYQEGRLDRPHSKQMMAGMLNRKPATVRAGIERKITQGTDEVKKRGPRDLAYYDRECAKLKPKP